MHEAWNRVRFLEVDGGTVTTIQTGKALPLRATIELAGLKPEDVRVEAVVGRLDADGNLEDSSVIALPVIEQHGTAFSFGHEYSPLQTGRLGFAFRISSNHYRDPLTRPTNALLKWSD